MKKKRLATVREAIKILNDTFQNDPEKSGRSVIATQTIYNAFNQKRLTRYGSSHFAQVDVEELLEQFGPKTA